MESSLMESSLNEWEAARSIVERAVNQIASGNTYEACFILGKLSAGCQENELKIKRLIDENK